MIQTVQQFLQPGPDGGVTRINQNSRKVQVIVSVNHTRQFQRIRLVARSHQSQRGIARKRPGEIDKLAVDARGQSGFRKAGTDCRGNVGRGGTGRHFAH